MVVVLPTYDGTLSPLLSNYVLLQLCMARKRNLPEGILLIFFHCRNWNSVHGFSILIQKRVLESVLMALS